MKPILSPIVALLLAASAAAQSVKLPDAVTVAPGRLAAVAVEYDGDDVRWRVSSDLDVFREYDPDPRKIRLRVIGYAPGRYELSAVACKGGKLSDFAACVITVGSPAPPPPPPPPTPSQKVAWVIVVEETAERTPQTARVLGDLPFWARLGVPRRVYDKDDPAVKTNRYDVAAGKAGGLPAMLLLSEAGDVLKSIKLPATVDEVRKEVGGK
jgi:hypothetical protein